MYPISCEKQGSLHDHQILIVLMSVPMKMCARSMYLVIDGYSFKITPLPVILIWQGLGPGLGIRAVAMDEMSSTCTGVVRGA